MIVPVTEAVHVSEKIDVVIDVVLVELVMVMVRAWVVSVVRDTDPVLVVASDVVRSLVVALALALAPDVAWLLWMMGERGEGIRNVGEGIGDIIGIEVEGKRRARITCIVALPIERRHCRCLRVSTV